MMQEGETRTEKTGLSQFSSEKYVSIESYRKNGDPARTPVWFVEDQGTIYVRTDNDTGKVKRIRRNPHVKIAACNIRGTPKSDWLEATTKFTEGEEARRALELLKKKYGLPYRLVRSIGKLQGRASKALVLAIR